MKKIFILALLVAQLSVYAQYLPNNSQAFQFYSVVNPAFTGIENFSDIKLSYRYQWTGFGNMAPKFINLSYNARLKQPADLSFNSLRPSNPALLRLPIKKRMIEGFSATVFQSQIGVIKSIGGGVNFSVNYPVVNDVRAAFGVGAYIENRKLDISSVTVREPDRDEYYNHLLNSSTTETDLNMRAGFLLYSPKYYFGVSYLPLMYTAIQATDVAMNRPFYKAAAQFGISLPVSDDLTFKPSALALLQLDNSVTYDVSVKAYIQKRFWTGLTYRSIQTGVGLLGFNLNETFSASYTYEFSLGRFQQFSGGSHELVLAMRLNNIKKYNQYTW
jgi:type IX secretion system PorP/SprF family membrane protein